ncbi:O-antigen/teichoic acid export membrane protein [Dysgonomonadaceae bacterium PH5-43]|nr:O-antigen/teichoic acid export membrane protein [Dysgonomonadaceae bacterium PH5-43]
MSKWNNFKTKYSSEFFKHSATLLSSNVVSQIISFAVYPVLTRLYNPDIFGNFVWLVSVSSILTILFTGRYELAIVLPKSKKKAMSLFQLAFIINISFFVISFILFALGGNRFAVFLEEESLTSLLPLVPVFAFLGASWQILNHFFIREKRYYNISSYNVVQSITNASVKCFLGIKGFVKTGLIIGQLSAQFLALTISVLLGQKAFKGFFSIDRSLIKEVAKEYSNFPKFSLPHGLLNILNLPVLILPFYFDMELVGLFSLAITIGQSPVVLLGGSAYQTLLQRISKKVQTLQNIKTDCIKFCKTCSFVLVPLLILFMFIPEGVFTWAFGAEWSGIGLVFKLIAPWLFVRLLVNALSFIPDIFFKQKTTMIIEVFFVLSRIGVLFVGVYFNSFILSVALFCILSFAVILGKLIWYFYLIGKYELSLK